VFVAGEVLSRTIRVDTFAVKYEYFFIKEDIKNDKEGFPGGDVFYNFSSNWLW